MRIVRAFFAIGCIHTSQNTLCLLHGDMGILTHSVVLDQELEVFDRRASATFEDGGEVLRIGYKVFRGFVNGKALARTVS